MKGKLHQLNLLFVSTSSSPNTSHHQHLTPKGKTEYDEEGERIAVKKMSMKRFVVLANQVMTSGQASFRVKVEAVFSLFPFHETVNID